MESIETCTMVKQFRGTWWDASLEIIEKESTEELTVNYSIRLVIVKGMFANDGGRLTGYKMSEMQCGNRYHKSRYRTCWGTEHPHFILS